MVKRRGIFQKSLHVYNVRRDVNIPFAIAHMCTQHTLIEVVKLKMLNFVFLSLKRQFNAQQRLDFYFFFIYLCCANGGWQERFKWKRVDLYFVLDIFVYCSATWFAFEKLKWKCSHLYTLEYTTLFSQVTYTFALSWIHWYCALETDFVSLLLAGFVETTATMTMMAAMFVGESSFLCLSFGLFLSRLFFTQHLLPSLTICLSPQFAYLFTQTEYSPRSSKTNWIWCT